MLALLKPVRRMISGTVDPASRSDLISATRSGVTSRFRPNFTPWAFALANSIHLSLAPDVVFELGDQCQNTHDELPRARSGVDRGVIRDFESHALVGELRDDAVKIRG